MSMTIRFFVPGRGQTAGSKNAFPYIKASGGLGVRVADQSGKKGKLWRVAVQVHAKNAYVGKPLIPHTYPLKVTMTFYRPRPIAHYKADGTVKPGMPAAPTQRPDVLKLARAIEDALTGVIYEDDSSIVEEHLFKKWAPTRELEGVEVVIEY